MATKETHNINPSEMIKLMVGRELKDIFEDDNRDTSSNKVLLEVKNLKNSEFFDDINFNIKKEKLLASLVL